jgi:protein SCO1/2
MSGWFQRNKPFVIAFVAGAVVLTILPFIQSQFLRAPEPIASLGSWQLVDESGKPFGSADLKGTVWIASFFFTHCPSLCPKQQEDMGKMLRHVDDLDGKKGVAPIVLVSFTVDPDNDTPEELTKYMQRLNAPAGKWKYLTGPRERIEDLLVKKFLVAMGKKDGTTGDIAHVSKFVLVDQNGDVRGFWDTDELARGNLINAARLLAKKGPRP